jgi:hypothetical protein
METKLIAGEYTYYKKEITGSYFATDKDKVGLYVIPLYRDNTWHINDLSIVETLEGINENELKEINSALGTKFTMEDFS